MGEISTKLSALTEIGRAQYVAQSRVTAKRTPVAFAPPKDVRNIKELVEEGYDPVHAAYLSAQNLVSFLAEHFSVLDEMEAYYNPVAAAEDEYMPSGPPWSPLSTSYFTTWAFFDLRFGPDLETMGTCILDMGEQLGINSGTLRIIRLFQETRMGIYEHTGLCQGRVQLRELVTGDEFSCRVPCGYHGQKGELWYVRLCPPPITEESLNYHIAFTTPYILCECTKADWVAYLRKSIGNEVANERQALYDFLKYGPQLNFWNEYIFLAYHNFQTEAVFLAGLPDVKSSLPHGELARQSPI